MDGAPRELFAVRERSNGDLVILTKSGLNHEEPDGSNNPILSDRTSVHVSKRSAGTTIKQTMELESGKKIENAAYIRGPKENLLWLDRACRAADLRNDRYLVEINPRDTVIELPSFDPVIQCVLYSITVFKTGAALPDVSPMFSRLIANFREFSIAVHFGYVPVPSLPHSDAVHLVTNTPRIDSAEQAGFLMPLGGEAKSERDLAQALFEVFARLGEKLLARVERDFPQFVETGYYDLRCRMISAAPFEDFEDLQHKIAHSVPLVLPSDNRPDSLYIGSV